MRTVDIHLSRGKRTVRFVSLFLSACLLVTSLALMPQQALAAISIAEIPVPTAGSGSFDIALGPDGALWFTEYWGNKIGRCTTSGVITNEYPLTNPASQPSYIVTGPDGNLWFTEFSGNRIGRITISGNITEFNVPTGASLPWGITVGPDGALWFTETTGNKIGRCTTSGVISELPITGGDRPEGYYPGSGQCLLVRRERREHRGPDDHLGGAHPVSDPNGRQHTVGHHRRAGR